MLMYFRIMSILSGKERFKFLSWGTDRKGTGSLRYRMEDAIFNFEYNTNAGSEKLIITVFDTHGVLVKNVVFWKFFMNKIFNKVNSVHRKKELEPNEFDGKGNQFIGV